jgi:putative membrane protein
MSPIHIDLKHHKLLTVTHERAYFFNCIYKQMPMKILYKLCKATVIALTAICLASSCSQNLTYHEAMSKNQRKIDDPNRLADANFLVDAKSFNILETKLAELATTTGYASKIVELARKDMDAHKNFSEDLDKLASREHVVLPDNMNDQHQNMYYELVKTDREDFDKSYLTLLARVNNDVTQQFQKMATDAADGDVRAFAAKKLDLLRNQEKLIDNVEDALLNTY